MARSHLRNHQIQQSIKNSLIGILGIILIIVALFLFGPQMLIDFSLLISKRNNGSVQKTTKDVAYVAPPILNPQPSATNSATIIITGSVTTGKKVKLFVNGQSDTTDVKNDGSFSFQSVKLDKGKNEIKAKAVTDSGKESEYSSSITISYLDKAPSLEITSPHDGDTIDHSPITVTGKTGANVHVTINDFWAISKDDGTFSYRLNLQDGDNHIKIVATDDAGNTAEKEITVKRN